MPQGKSETPPIDKDNPKKVEIAYLAMGCFWGVDALFGVQKGVISTAVGYTGGEEENPTYYNLGGHTETVKVAFDPKTITYEKLLDIFWQSHYAGVPPYSRQYMSAVFYVGEEQREIAVRKKEVLEKRSGAMLYTEITPFDTFYTAEDYHQKYRLRQVKEIEREFKQIYPEDKAFTLSTAAARVNGYLAGLGSEKSLKEEKNLLGLTPSALKILMAMHKSMMIKK